MELFYLVILVLFGVLFLVAEIVLLPGVSIGGILSLVCYGTAGYLAFHDYGVSAGVTVVAVIVVLSVLATVFSLRAKTWQRFSLRQKIASASNPTPEELEVKIGDRGVALSRLCPMGKVRIGGTIVEAKSLDAYVDPRTEVEVVDFENFNVVVKIVKQDIK